MTASTHPPEGASAHGGVRSEDDHVPTLTLFLVGLCALLIFFLGGFAAVSYLHHAQVENGPVIIPPEMGESKIGLVEQQQFQLVARGERERAAQEKRLKSYGWADKAGGMAHIPIDEAMRRVSQGARPAGANP